MPSYLRSARTLIPLLAGFMVLALSELAGAWLFERQQRASQWVRHTLEVENIIDSLSLRAADAEAGLRDYLLSANSADLAPYADAIRPMPAEVEALALMTADNANQRTAIHKLRAALQAEIEALQRAVVLSQAAQAADAQDYIRTGPGRDSRIQLQAILDSMRDEENRLLAIRTERVQRSVALGRGVWLGSALAVLVLSVFVAWDARRRIQVLQETNRRLETEAGARQEAQGQVRQLQKMQAVGQLTGGIAHDFNNMLAIVIGSLDLARRRLTGAEHPQLAQLLGSATDGAQKAAALTSRLLAFARQQPLEPKVADANKLVAQTSEICDARWVKPSSSRRFSPVACGGCLWIRLKLRARSSISVSTPAMPWRAAAGSPSKRPMRNWTTNMRARTRKLQPANT